MSNDSAGLVTGSMYADAGTNPAGVGSEWIIPRTCAEVAIQAPTHSFQNYAPLGSLQHTWRTGWRLLSCHSITTARRVCPGAKMRKIFVGAEIAKATAHLRFPLPRAKYSSGLAQGWGRLPFILLLGI